jgi:hypothetical protein
MRDRGHARRVVQDLGGLPHALFVRIECLLERVVLPVVLDAARVLQQLPQGDIMPMLGPGALALPPHVLVRGRKRRLSQQEARGGRREGLRERRQSAVANEEKDGSGREHLGDGGDLKGRGWGQGVAASVGQHPPGSLEEHGPAPRLHARDAPAVAFVAFHDLGKGGGDGGVGGEAGDRSGGGPAQRGGGRGGG